MRAARVDANQGAIVDALRAAGASVEILSAVGGGLTDLLVGFRGVNYLLEIKDGDKPASKQALTPEQVKWHASWRGQKQVVNSVASALRAILAQ